MTDKPRSSVPASHRITAEKYRLVREAVNARFKDRIKFDFYSDRNLPEYKVWRKGEVR